MFTKFVEVSEYSMIQNKVEGHLTRHHLRRFFSNMYVSELIPSTKKLSLIPPSISSDPLGNLVLRLYWRSLPLSFSFNLPS